MSDEAINRNILFIENNYSLAGSWKKFLQLLFEVDVEPAVSVAEVAEDIRNKKFAMIFIHLPFPEKTSKAFAEEIRQLEKEANVEPTPLYIFVLPSLPEDLKASIAVSATEVLENDDMLIDAGNYIVNDLGIPPKMKNTINLLNRRRAAKKND